MRYERIWKAALALLLVISAVLVAPSLFGGDPLPDNWIRALGTADVLALLVTVFSFVRSYQK